MEDFCYPCCEENKKLKAVVFKDGKDMRSGFYIWSCLTNQWALVRFCPFCAKEVSKVNCMI